MSNWYKMLRD